MHEMKKMNKYTINHISIDSADLKCMVVSSGVKVDGDVYHVFKNKARLNTPDSRGINVCVKRDI